MQYFICNKKNSLEKVIIRINDSDNTQYVEYFDYDGNFKKCDLINLNLGDEVQEISPSQFEKIKNANYKFYFCKKTEPMLLIRIFNDVYLQIYDEDNNIWKNAPNTTWIADILYDGDPDFEEISSEVAKAYMDTKINKKMTR